MGATTKYGLPWPDVSAFLRDGATAIRQLAEGVEGALLPPLLVTTGSAEANYGADKTGEPGWNVDDDANRKRGGWRSPGDTDRLVIPALPGWYLVCASVRFGGKSEPDWYDAQLRTRAQGDAVGSGTLWARTRIELPATSDTFTHLTVSGMVRIGDTDPDTGFTVRMAYGGATKPPDSDPADHKLTAIRLSAL